MFDILLSIIAGFAGRRSRMQLGKNAMKRREPRLGKL